MLGTCLYLLKYLCRNLKASEVHLLFSAFKATAVYGAKVQQFLLAQCDQNGSVKTAFPHFLLKNDLCTNRNNGEVAMQQGSSLHQPEAHTAITIMCITSVVWD